MMWLLLEAGVAGLLLVMIVWWTLPSKKNDARPYEPHEQSPSAPDRPDDE